MRLERFAFNVAAYQHAVRHDETPPPPPLMAAQHLAVVRSDYVVRTVALPDREYAFLSAMTEGGTIRDGIAAVARLRGMAGPPHIRTQWVAPGLFAA